MIATQRKVRPGTVALWAFQIGLAALFLMAGGAKLAGSPMMVAEFARIGIGQWFRYLTGTLEVLGALAILVPSLSAVGALMLSCVMTGAVITHLLILGGSPMPAIILGISSVGVLIAHRDQVLEYVEMRR